MRRTQITMLNGMAGSDFHQALDQFAAWGLEHVDLKNGIYGKSIEALSDSEANAATAALHERGLNAYCFSTELFHDDLEKGEEHFRQQHLSKIDRAIQVAERMRPNMIRLLSARTTKRLSLQNSTDYILAEHPWLIALYQEAIDRIHGAGFQVTIENEAHSCIWSTPEEIITFYEALGRQDKVHYTYDVQNLWQMGTYPSLEVYRKLRPLIGFLHLKGGQQGEEGNALVWKSTLEEASWPVAELTAEAIRDGVSPVICLNPSHGKPMEGRSYTYEQDLHYLKQLIEQVEGDGI
jgi:hypothetical protein